MFPSPYGDVVLKCARTIKEISPEDYQVSVPLRGCGFEMFVGMKMYEIDEREFPSPYGDVVLK